MVLFDLKRNVKSYIQSRGRARHATSRLLVLARADDDDEDLLREARARPPRNARKGAAAAADLLRVDRAICQMSSALWSPETSSLPALLSAAPRPAPSPQLQDCELRMRGAAMSRAAQVEAGGDASDDGDGKDGEGELTPGAAAGASYIVERTGAFVTEAEAVGKLNAVASRIPRDKWTEAWQPDYAFSFAGAVHECTVSLPQKRRAFAAAAQSKRLAKRRAALQAVAELHRCGLLDDRLKPLSAVVSRGNREGREAEEEEAEGEGEGGGGGGGRWGGGAAAAGSRVQERTPEALSPCAIAPGATYSRRRADPSWAPPAAASPPERSRPPGAGLWHLSLLAPAIADAEAEWFPLGLLTRSPLPAALLPPLRLDDLQRGPRCVQHKEGLEARSHQPPAPPA